MAFPRHDWMGDCAEVDSAISYFCRFCSAFSSFLFFSFQLILFALLMSRTVTSPRIATFSFFALKPCIEKDREGLGCVWRRCEGEIESMDERERESNYCST
jgi:hypothetical protein